MHRASAPFCTSGSFSKKLSHSGASAASTSKVVPVTSISRHYEISLLQHRCSTYGYCLFTDIEVQKSTYLSLGVEPRRLLFESPNTEHLPVKICNKFVIHKS